MTVLPNCVLLDVRLPGVPDDYGKVAAAGVVAWTGRLSGYLKRENRRTMTGTLTTGQQMTVVDRDILYVQGAPYALASATAGDQQSASTVLVDDRRKNPSVQRRMRVVAVEDRAAGLPVDSVRVELDDQTA